MIQLLVILWRAGKFEMEKGMHYNYCKLWKISHQEKQNNNYVWKEEIFWINYLAILLLFIS